MQEIDLLPQFFFPGVHNLKTNTDLVVDHHHKLDVRYQHSQGAFLPVKDRYLYLLGPQPTVCGDLDPTYQGHVFQDSSLEEPDLESTMGDWVPQDIKIRVLIAARESYTRNQEKVQTLNSKAGVSTSSIWSGYRQGGDTERFGRVQTALTFVIS